MKNRNKKDGNSIVTMPIVLIISLVFILIIGVFVINSIFPFIWYEKLNSITQKYMFVIEKYGYLTHDEKENMISDLKNQGFKIDNIIINAPDTIKSYGELIEFNVEYKIEQNNPIINIGKIGNDCKNIKLVIYKNSYCKR